MKRFFLYSLIVSIALSAILGVYVIVSGRQDAVTERILVTSGIVAGASVCGLACGALFATGRARLLPVAGITLALAGSALALTLIWSETNSEAAWKLTGSFGILAIAAAHMSLLCLARLGGPHRLVLAAAIVVILALAAMLVAILYGGVAGDAWIRVIGVLAVLAAAASLVIPILHRLGRTRAAELEPAAIDAEIARLKARLLELESLRSRRTT